MLFRSGDLFTAPSIISVSPLSLATDVTDATLGANVLWLEARAGAGGIATLASSFFGRSPWLHGQQVDIFYHIQNSSFLIAYYYKEPIKHHVAGISKHTQYKILRGL